MTAAQVRVDPSDNIWAVDEMSNMVMKFDPEGRVAMLLGRKAESETIPPRVPGERRGTGYTDLFSRPTDVAWDAAGNIFVADGAGNASPSSIRAGKFIKSWGSEARGGEFLMFSVLVDAQERLAGDGGNKRIRCLTTTASSRRCFRTLATHRRCASTRANRSSTFPIPIRGTISMSPVKLRSAWTERSSANCAPEGCSRIRRGQLHRLPQRKHSLCR